jgi:hypothetical protein
LLGFLTEARQVAVRADVEKASALPREQRIAWSAREARRLSSARLRRGLEGVDPSWIVEGLRGESPGVIAASLRFLPTPVRRNVERHLPRKVREALPDRKAMAEVDKVWLVRVRELLDRQVLELIPDLRAGVTVEVPQLEAALRRFGEAEAALGLQQVGRAALARFLGSLDDERAAAVKEVLKGATGCSEGRTRRAERFWGRAAGGEDSTEAIALRSGLWQLAHVLVDAEFGARLRGVYVYLPHSWVQELDRLEEVVKPAEPGFSEALMNQLGLLPGASE